MSLSVRDMIDLIYCV